MAKGIPTYEDFLRSLSGTPMQREARGIYNAARRQGINPAFVAGLAAAESSYGTAGYARGTYNPYGLGVHLGWKFPNYTKATERLGSTLNSLGYPGLYKSRGIAGVISQYTPASDGNDEAAHVRNIISYGKKTKGNPSLIYTGRSMQEANAAPMADPYPQNNDGVAKETPVAYVSDKVKKMLAQQYLRTLKGTLSPEFARETTMALMSDIAAPGGSRAMASSGGMTAPAPRGSGGPITPMMTGYGSTRGVVRPLPTPLGGGDYGYADKEGQDGRHLADDWFAPANTPVAAPVSGTVFRVKPDKEVGKKSVGQVFGGTVYIRDKGGRIFVFRHLENPQRYTQAGQQVTAGQRIGAVKAWGTAPHAHIEMYRPGPYSYSSARAMDPNQFFRQAGIR